MNRAVIPINGRVTEVVVDTDLDRVVVTVNGPASVHSQVIPQPQWQATHVQGAVLVIRADADDLDERTHEWLAELGERVRKAGGVATVFVDRDWQVDAETIEELIAMASAGVPPEGTVPEGREAPVETERTNPDTDTTNGENGGDSGDDGRHDADQPVDTGSVPNETVDESGNETDYGAQQRTGDPDAKGGTERPS